LQFALDAEEILNTLSLMEIKDRTWTIQACSAVTKEGLQEGMEWLVKTISEKK
jgi:ADP-ribosylation factor-like protein 3